MISSFLPSAVFVYVATSLFRHFLPAQAAKTLNDSSELFGGNWVFALVFTMWFGFGLYTSQHWTIQFFEGYKLKTWGRVGQKTYSLLQASARRRTQKKFRRYHFKVRKEIENYNPRMGQVGIRKQDRERAFAELQEVETLRPLNDNDILPTRLGNVLRAAEYYPAERYKMEGISLYPRLLHVVPLHFKNYLAELNNRFIFLLHSAALAYILGAISFILGIFGATLSRKPLILGIQLTYHHPINAASPQFYLITGIAIFGLGYVIYRASVQSAEELYIHIRTGYDLYRHRLLVQLNQPIPRSLQEEQKLWEELSEFFIAGNRLRFPYEQFDFVYDPKTVSSDRNDSDRPE